MRPIEPETEWDQELDLLVDELMEDRMSPKNGNPLVSEHQIRSQIQQEVKEMVRFEKETEAVSHSLALLKSSGLEIHGAKRIDEIIYELHHVGEKLIELAEEISHAPEKTATLIGIQDQTLADLLRVGLEEYENERWENAESLYRFLTVLAPVNPELWLCLGSALQNQSKFDEARKGYLRAMELDSVDPYYPLYIAECYLLEGDIRLCEEWEQMGRQRAKENQSKEEIIGLFDDLKEAITLVEV